MVFVGDISVVNYLIQNWGYCSGIIYGFHGIIYGFHGIIYGFHGIIYGFHGILTHLSLGGKGAPPCHVHPPVMFFLAQGDILAQRLDEANSQSVANVIYALPWLKRTSFESFGGGLISETAEPLKSHGFGPENVG